MLAFLALSFLATNGMHAYLLLSQTENKKVTISHSAALSNENYAIFITGHFFGGLFSLIAGYKFFYQDVGSSLLFYILAFGVFFEQLQALVPARNNLEKPHTVLATFMSICIVLILLLAPFIISLSTLGLTVYLMGIVFLLASGVYAIFNYEKFYLVQMIFFSMFYVMILILYFGRA